MVGVTLGLVEGEVVGSVVGASVGTSVGASLGDVDGAVVGTSVGSSVGISVGVSVSSVGRAVPVGSFVGYVGYTVGYSVGARDALQMPMRPPHSESPSCSWHAGLHSYPQVPHFQENNVPLKSQSLLLQSMLVKQNLSSSHFVSHTIPQSVFACRGIRQRALTQQ